MVGAVPQSFRRAAHILRDGFEIKLDDGLTIAKWFYKPSPCGLRKDHFPATQRESEAAPRRFMMTKQPSPNATQFLKRNAMLVPQYRNRPKSDDVPEGINAPERPPFKLVE